MAFFPNNTDDFERLTEAAAKKVARQAKTAVGQVVSQVLPQTGPTDGNVASQVPEVSSDAAGSQQAQDTKDFVRDLYGSSQQAPKQHDPGVEQMQQNNQGLQPAKLTDEQEKLERIRRRLFMETHGGSFTIEGEEQRLAALRRQQEEQERQERAREDERKKEEKKMEEIKEQKTKQDLSVVRKQQHAEKGPHNVGE